MRCILAGLFAVVAAAVLVMLVVGAWQGWWSLGDRPSPPTLPGLVAAGLIATAASAANGRLQAEAGFWALALALAWAAGNAREQGTPSAPCALVFLAAVVLAWQGWRLAHTTAGAVLRAGQRR